ncbi:hypothetical protein D3C72_2159160 [compost metagenome]
MQFAPIPTAHGSLLDHVQHAAHRAVVLINDSEAVPAVPGLETLFFVAPTEIEQRPDLVK